MADEATAALRRAAASYHENPEFLKNWSGLAQLDVVARTAQQRAFVRGLGPVWPSLAGLDILDFGCGSARWLRWYLELGAEVARVHGVDVSDARFAEARAIHPGLDLRQIDGRTLPFADASFDLVSQWVCFMCVPSHAWRLELAAELRRVLRPGGYVFWWDTPRANPRLSDGAPLDPAAFFPGLAVHAQRVRLGGRPSDAFSPRLQPWLAPLLDWLTPGYSHIAARIGPALPLPPPAA